MIERGRLVVGRLQGGKTTLFHYDWLFSEVHASTLTQFWPGVIPGQRKPLSLRKTISRKQRALKRYLLSRYYLTSAYRDMRVAVSRNQDVVFANVLLTFVLAYAFAATAFDFTLLFLNTAYDLNMLTGIDMRVLLLVVAGVLTSLSAWVLAFVMNIVTISVQDGANRKRTAHIVPTLQRGLKDAGAVSLAWLPIAIRTALPILIGAISGAFYMKYGVESFSLPVYIWAAAVMALIIISLWQLTTYGLAPFVVLLEGLRGRDAMKRSRELVSRRGRLFMLTTYLAFALSAGAFGTISVELKQSIGTFAYVMLAFIMIAQLLLTNGILTTFYRKRKLARS